MNLEREPEISYSLQDGIDALSPPFPFSVVAKVRIQVLGRQQIRPLGTVRLIERRRIRSAAATGTALLASRTRGGLYGYEEHLVW